MYSTNKNNKSLSKSWDKGKELQTLKHKYKDSKNFIEISYLLYLSLPHEMRAKLQEFNAHIKNYNGDDIKMYIRSTKTYKDVEYLSKASGNNILSKLKKDIEYDNIIKDFNNNFLLKFNNYEQNILNYFKYIRNKNKTLLEKLIRTSYNILLPPEEDVDIDYGEYK